MSECRESDAGRLVNDQHNRDCNLSGCPGCKPCTPDHGHCTSCEHRHLAEGERWVCVRCVGKVRENLNKISNYTTQAHREVVQRGINSAAFLVAAPAADPEAHGFLHQSATSGRLCKCRTRGHVCPATLIPAKICPDAAFALEDARDELHPLTVLGWWQMAWEEHLGTDVLGSDDTDDQHFARITVAGAWRYLTEHLTKMAQEFEPDFEQFRTEVRDCTTWLENILGEGVREERGVQCFMCGKAQLVKWYDPEPATDEHGEVYGPNDHWFCPREDCGHWWTEEIYRTRVQGTYLAKADRLTASQIATTYRVPEGTVRGWATATKWRDPLVRRRGKDAYGLTLYDVADVLAARDRVAAPRESDRVP